MITTNHNKLTPGPYLADRATVRAWADNGDATVSAFLESSDFGGEHADDQSFETALEATPIFGVYDGEIRVWFSIQAAADAWLAVTVADPSIYGLEAAA
jgi:hypothetical protein